MRDERLISVALGSKQGGLTNRRAISISERNALRRNRIQNTPREVTDRRSSRVEGSGILHERGLGIQVDAKTARSNAQLAEPDTTAKGIVRGRVHEHGSQNSILGPSSAISTPSWWIAKRGSK